MSLFRSLLLFPALAAVAVGAVAAADEPVPVPPAAAPAGQVLALTGAFEEAFALDGAAGRLALVRVADGAVHELEVVDVAQKGAVLARIPLGAADPAAVTLSPAGVFLLTRSPDGATVEGALHDLTGKLVRKHGPATDLVLVDEGAGAVVGAFTRKGATVEVTRTPAAAARPTSKRTLTVDASGTIAAFDLVPVAWRGGYARLVGRRLGGYDKAKDRQMNDGEGVYDVATGKVTEKPIMDVIAWTRVQRERATRWNVEAFVALDGGKLHAVTAADQIVPLADVPVAIYEPSSLRQQSFPDGRVVFSLTVDPLNPEAMERKKRDPEVIHVYRFDAAATPAVQRVLEIPTLGRDFVWRAAANRMALLRKHKSFGRGGPELEVWEW